MAKNTGTLVGAPVRPADSNDAYAVAYQSEIKGGLHSGATISERDNLPAYLREAGMLFYVVGDKTYQLGDDLATWTIFTGSGSGTGGDGSVGFADWVALPFQHSAISAVQLPLMYKLDGANDAAILHLQAQFNIDPSYSATSITLGTLPDGCRPPAQVKLSIICQATELYVQIEMNGDVKIVSKFNEFNIPTGTDEPYCFMMFYKPAAAGGATTFYAFRSGNFTRNDCDTDAGEEGSVVTYSHTYSSTVSQDDADSIADANFDTDGQAYANLHGTCTVPDTTNYTAVTSRYAEDSINICLATPTTYYVADPDTRIDTGAHVYFRNHGGLGSYIELGTGYIIGYQGGIYEITNGVVGAYTGADC